MICPKCGARARCYDSRTRENGLSVTRRRECTSRQCRLRFTTREKIVETEGWDAEMEAIAER